MEVVKTLGGIYNSDHSCVKIVQKIDQVVCGFDIFVHIQRSGLLGTIWGLPLGTVYCQYQCISVRSHGGVDVDKFNAIRI